MRAVQFISVSSCTRTSPLEAFQLQMLFYDADNRCLRMPVPCDISWTVLWVQGWSCWLRTISFTWSLVSSVRAFRGLPLSWCLSSVHCACVSELLEQPVNATFRPFFVQKFFLQLSRIISLRLIQFFRKLESFLRRWKPCLQTMQ